MNVFTPKSWAPDKVTKFTPDSSVLPPARIWTVSKLVSVSKSENWIRIFESIYQLTMPQNIKYQLKFPKEYVSLYKKNEGQTSFQEKKFDHKIYWLMTASHQSINFML